MQDLVRLHNYPDFVDKETAAREDVTGPMSRSIEEWGSQPKPKSVENKIKVVTWKTVILSTQRHGSRNHYLGFSLKADLSLQFLYRKFYVLNTIEPQIYHLSLLSRGVHIS